MRCPSLARQLTVTHAAQHSRERILPQRASLSVHPIPRPEPPPFASLRQDHPRRSRRGPRSPCGKDPLCLGLCSDICGRHSGDVLVEADTGPYGLRRGDCLQLLG